MPNLDKGTAVARVACPDCGTKGTVKLDKNGRGYLYCSGEHPDGAPCNCRHHFSTHTSQKMQAAYLAARKAPKSPASKEVKPDGEPTGVQEQPRNAAPSREYDPFDL